jgi:polyisoprenyl-teichoic acid--peptidoglycan teichoic acid transferase
MPPLNRKPRTSLWIVLLLLLTACASAGQEPSRLALPTITQLYIVTNDPNATATPTPFQPLGPDGNPQPSSTPIPPTIFPTVTLNLTLTPDFGGVLPGTLTPTLYIIPDGSITPMPALTDAETVTFLLLGSDVPLGQPFRTDSIVVAAIRPKLGQVTLISIPRDLWVYIPTHGMDRINTAFENGALNGYPGGGAALLRDTIQYNLGIRIDHTAIVDFNGFKRIIDTMGGIDVPVYCSYTDWRLKAPDLYVEDENNWALFTVGPGVVHMDGDLALWYARSRKKSSDFDRGRRQQEVLRSIYGRGLQLNIITKIPQLYNDLSSTVQTDVGLSTLLDLAPLALHLSNADIRSFYISPPLVTSWTTPGGASVQVPDGNAIRNMLTNALSPSRKSEKMEALVIEIWNGTQNGGWDALAGERLNYAGYETKLAPADRLDHSQTLLYDVSPDQDASRAASLLAILGLPASALVAAPGYREDVAYVLIVGTDYQPCFKPQNLAP